MTLAPRRSHTHGVYTRLPDWPARLSAFLIGSMRKQAAGELQFNWDPSVEGSVNCLTFAGSAMEALFGVNPYALLGGDLAYTDPRSAMRSLQAAGYDSTERVMDILFTEQPVSKTVRGDLVFIPTALEIGGLRWVSAIADPPYFWVVSSAYGLSKGELRRVSKSYSTFQMCIPDRTVRA